MFERVWFTTFATLTHSANSYRASSLCQVLHKYTVKWAKTPCSWSRLGNNERATRPGAGGGSRVKIGRRLLGEERHQAGRGPGEQHYRMLENSGMNAKKRKWFIYLLIYLLPRFPILMEISAGRSQSLVSYLLINFLWRKESERCQR